jgi:hypothetical protein
LTIGDIDALNTFAAYRSKPAALNMPYLGGHAGSVADLCEADTLRAPIREASYPTDARLNSEHLVKVS